MRSAIFVDRTALGRAVLQFGPPGMVPDYKKLSRLLAPGEPDPVLVVWGLDMPPTAVDILTGAGWEVHNLRRIQPGLVENEMAQRAAHLPASVDRLVLVTGSGAVVPTARECARGMQVLVAFYVGATSCDLRNVDGVTFVDLPSIDFLRPKARKEET